MTNLYFKNNKVLHKINDMERLERIRTFHIINTVKGYDFELSNKVVAHAIEHRENEVEMMAIKSR